MLPLQLTQLQFGSGLAQETLKGREKEMLNIVLGVCTFHGVIQMMNVKVGDVLYDL